MPERILDASAVMAFLMKETGSEVVTELFPAAMSSVNVVEVAVKRSIRFQVPHERTISELLEIVDVIPFEARYMAAAASLPTVAGKRRLSLADRACLATAIVLGLPVFTSDQLWVEIATGADVRLIR